MSGTRKCGFNLAWAASVAALVLIVFPAVTLLVLNWSDDRTARWIYEIRKRKHHAAERVASQPRLLVVGGSSGFFSVDAELLTAKLGRPAVNLATHAGLRLRYLLGDVQRIARPGDVVLLYLEYEQYRYPRGFPVILRNYLWTYERAGLLRLPWSEMVQQLYGYSAEEYRASWKRKPLQPGSDETALWQGYSYCELSAAGDYRGKVGSKRVPQAASFAGKLAIEPGAAKELTGFIRWARKHDVRVINAFPGMLRSEPGDRAELRRTVDEIGRFYRKQKIAVLKTSATRELPRELLLDTNYHANSAGRRLITEALVRELKPLLGIPKREGPPTTFLVGSRFTAFEPASLFLDNDDVEYRYVDDTYLQHLLCLTTAKAAEMAAAGQRVLFSEPEVQTLFANAAVPTTLVKQQTTKLGDWLARYPQHVFALTQLGLEAKESPKLPEGLGWEAASYQAALIGTGRYAGIHSHVSGQTPVTLRRARSDQWPNKKDAPMEVFLRSSPETSEAAILVEGVPIVRNEGLGVAVAVLDPESGTVIRHAVFQAGELREGELWQVDGPAR